MGIADQQSFKKIIVMGHEILFAIAEIELPLEQMAASDFLSRNLLTSISLWRIFYPKAIEDFPENGRSATRRRSLSVQRPG